jgi:cytochrome c biogenesis protein CcdA
VDGVTLAATAAARDGSVVSDLIWPILLLGLGDSLNPATIAAAIVIAANKGPVVRVLAFATGTGVTYFLGGVVLVLAPAALLNALLHPTPSTRTHVAEIVIGILALAFAAWVARQPTEKVSRHLPTNVSVLGAFTLGAAITVVDLPTALMYFAAIALTVGAGLTKPERIGLLVVFNIAYVTPLLLVAALVAVLGKRATPILTRMNELVARWGPRVLAAITGACGCYLVAIGVIGLV